MILSRTVSALVLFAAFAVGETGIIVPSGPPGLAVDRLSIESMDVNIAIDNGHAVVSICEVFRNRSQYVLEGNYSLALPDDGAVSDFAVWDDLTRIPGVILERKQAAELYEQIRVQAIDPGLLESGEATESNSPGEAAHSRAFSVKISPIPAYGYKRLEASYRQSVRIARSASDFVLPLKAPASIGRLTVNLDIRSVLPISQFENVGNRYGLKISQQTADHIVASGTVRDVRLGDDLELKYSLANSETPQVTTYRNDDVAEPGYFEATQMLQETPAAENKEGAGRNVVLLFDTSLSMQWEKLERSFQALEAVLRSLGPKDSFNVLVFNSAVTPFASEPQAASTDAVARSLDFVRGTRLRGGTNVGAAFHAAFSQCGANSYVVLLSDGEMTDGVIAPSRLAAETQREWRALPSTRRPHIYTLAIGDDANVGLMRRLAAQSGVAEQVNSTEPLDYKLGNFVHEIGLAPLSPVTLTARPAAALENVYRVGRDDFPGSQAQWVGEYKTPGPVEFEIATGLGTTQRKQSARVELPVKDTQHEYLPVAWAWARVQALLEKIDRDGEDKASIEEIIRLARKYHFVTPYTSFLAAPRALLRPRLIRPGDPMLRVRTDPAISSVVALFPFGLTQPLRYVAREDIWQTRFVAPDNLADGSYTVRLILRDKQGQVYEERKTFLVSSQAPVVRVTLGAPRVHAGGSLRVKVEASATTRLITAKLYGAPALALHWSDADKANSGDLLVPSNLPAGRYSLHVTAEDIAHNVSHQEVPLEVVP